MATINFELRNNADKAGLCRIRIVIQDKGKRRFIPMSLKLDPKYWDKNLQRVNNKHPQATVINNVLNLRFADLQSQLSTDELKGKIDINKIAGKSVGKTDFRSFALACLGRWENSKGAGTLKAYKSMLNKVEEYVPGLALEDITPDWLISYENHSRKECRNTNGLKRIEFVSVIIHEALRQGKIERNPFLIYKKPKWDNPKKEWLTMKEIERLEKFCRETKITPLKHTVAWFLFCCYTGLRYGDAAAFDVDKNIKNGRIILYTQKTGEVVSIKLTKKIKMGLQMIKGATLLTNQKVNDYLKTIASLNEIDKDLSFHAARHTFGVTCANLGISQEVTAKLLGHGNLKTTAIYYKIINPRVDAEMDKWDK